VREQDTSKAPAAGGGGRTTRRAGVAASPRSCPRLALRWRRCRCDRVDVPVKRCCGRCWAWRRARRLRPLGSRRAPERPAR